MNFLENKVPPPALVILLGLVMYFASMFMPREAPQPLLQWVAIAVLLGFAGYFGIQAIGLFKQSDTTIDPVRIHRASSLVTTGVYQVTRNPMYVGLTLILCAWGVWLWSSVQLIGPVFFIAFIQRFQILPEERVMEEKFGSEYLQYKTTVRRWL
jgi:protein-S-isoprenylcysteine O-methyltransferase Ste14